MTFTDILFDYHIIYKNGVEGQICRSKPVTSSKLTIKSKNCLLMRHPIIIKNLSKRILIYLLPNTTTA